MKKINKIKLGCEKTSIFMVIPCLYFHKSEKEIGIAFFNFRLFIGLWVGY